MNALKQTHSASTAFQPEVNGELRHLGYTIRRAFVDDFHLRHIESIPENSRVLDLGGHRKAKRGVFNLSNCPLRVTVTNLTADKCPDVLGDAGLLPYADGCFDAVVCAELLEHVPDCPLVLREVARVLRPGGKLLITAPFLYRVHADPHDHSRHTDHHWRMMLDEVDMCVETLERQGHMWCVMADTFKQWANSRRSMGKPRTRVMRALVNRTVRGVQRMALRADAKEKSRTDKFMTSFTTGFGIVAVRNSL